MLKTELLGLPIYNNPETDLFKVQDWNDANISLEASHKDLTKFKHELPLVNANAEIIDARGEERTLGDKIRNIESKISGTSIVIDFIKLKSETWDETINRAINMRFEKISFLNHNYDLYNTIILKDNTHIEMSDDTTLTRVHSGYTFLNSFTKEDTGYNATKNIKIENGTIIHDGNPTGKNLCLLFHCDNVHFTNVTFKNVINSHAIDITGCQNVHIRKCKFLGYISTSVDKYREVIQIDLSTVTGAGLDQVLFPKESPCFDGTRSRYIYIENCLFDKSDTCPPPHNCIGTHSQVANPLAGDTRSNNIYIKNNTFKGNGLIVTEVDDDIVARSGKCIRLIQMKNVYIEDNTFENYGRVVSCEIFGSIRALTGEKITDIPTIKTNDLGNVNVYIKGNVITAPLVENSYNWNCISIASSIEDVRHSNFKINENIINNLGGSNNISIGLGNIDIVTCMGNTITGAGKGIYVNATTSSDVSTRDNKYSNVLIPVDFLGAYSGGSGEGIELWSDGTDNRFVTYMLNTPASDVVNNPTLRIKSIKTGITADMLTGINIKDKEGIIKKVTPLTTAGYVMPTIQVGEGLELTSSSNIININVTSPTFNDIVYAEGVSNYSSTVKVTYSRNAEGYVHLEGACTTSTVEIGKTLFNLPVGFRPKMSLAFLTVASGSNNTNRIKVNINGDVVLENTTSTGLTPYINLNGIVFSTK